MKSFILVVFVITAIYCADAYTTADTTTGTGSIISTIWDYYKIGGQCPPGQPLNSLTSYMGSCGDEHYWADGVVETSADCPDTWNTYGYSGRTFVSSCITDAPSGAISSAGFWHATGTGSPMDNVDQFVLLGATCPTDSVVAGVRFDRGGYGHTWSTTIRYSDGIVDTTDAPGGYSPDNYYDAGSNGLGLTMYVYCLPLINNWHIVTSSSYWTATADGLTLGNECPSTGNSFVAAIRYAENDIGAGAQFQCVDIQQTVPVCGNGIVENPEQCDGSSCCSSSCTVISGCGVATGDPHFNGLSGGYFDFQGVPNEVFNILSDQHLQVNSLFSMAETKNNVSFTYMSAVGIQIGRDIRVLLEENKVYLNDVLVASNGTEIVLGDSVIYVVDDETFIKLPRYSLKFIYEQPALPFYYGIVVEYSTGSYAIPHGLLGQTANGKPVRGTDQQGKGAIEGEGKDYLVQGQDLFGSKFTFNKFTGEMPPSSDISRRSVPVSGAVGH